MGGHQLRGRTAVVTGAGRGIGHAIALDLAANGVSVLVTDVLAAVGETAAAINAAGGMARAHSADLLNCSEVNGIFGAAVGAFGGVDILVNVAGLLQNLAVVDYTEAVWDLHTDLNYKAVFLCSQAAARLMIPRRVGKIVNIASTSAFVASRVPNAAYDSTKGAVRQLTVSMGRELRHSTSRSTPSRPERSQRK